MSKIIPLYIFTLLAILGCSSLFFYPQKGLFDNPIVVTFNPDDVYFKTIDGLTLHGWFLKAEKPQHGTILVLHGNAENISTHVNSVLWLVKEGFNIFIFDYRGYGMSEGTPTLAGVHKDAEAAMQHLITLPEVNADKVVVFGQSIGGAIAIYTFATSPHKDKVKAIIIEGTFSSYRLITREKLARFFITWPFQYPLSFLFDDSYSPIIWLPKISPIPLLIIHGRGDEIVPLHHSQILFNIASVPKELWTSAQPGHITSFTDETIRKNLVIYLLKILHAES